MSRLLPRPKAELPYTEFDESGKAFTRIIDASGKPLVQRFWVDGRMLRTLTLHPYITCEDTEMNALANKMPVQSRWFWKPRTQWALPDADGNTGVWVLCIADRIRTTRNEQPVILGCPIAPEITHVDVWEPFYTARNPLFARLPIYQLDELEFWFMHQPVFQKGDTPAQRADGWHKFLGACFKQVFVDQHYRGIQAEITKQIGAKRVVKRAEQVMYTAPYEDRIRYSRGLTAFLKAEEEHLERACTV